MTKMTCRIYTRVLMGTNVYTALLQMTQQINKLQMDGFALSLVSHLKSQNSFIIKLTNGNGINDVEKTQKPWVTGH